MYEQLKMFSQIHRSCFEIINPHSSYQKESTKDTNCQLRPICSFMASLLATNSGQQGYGPSIGLRVNAPTKRSECEK